MHAGDPPIFKRGAPSSAAVRQQGAFGAQKPARRGAAASVTQGRHGAAGANAFLPPQLKGRWDLLDDPLALESAVGRTGAHKELGDANAMPSCLLD